MSQYLSVENSESIARSAPAVAPRRAAGIVVWFVWAAMFMGALVFVSKYGSNVPSWDGWDMVPVLTHHQPVTLHWLWSQHNEHRVPLPRLILIGLHRVAGIDFRRPMFFNVVLVAALAVAMILAAKRVRGFITYTDAFFPLLMLNWGQATNLIWGWQVQFYASMALSAIALLLILRSGPEMRLRTAVPLGVCAVLLPLCGANGLVLVPPLGLYLGYVAYRHRGSPTAHAKRDSMIVLAVAAFACVLCFLYLIGWERVPYYGVSFSIWFIAHAAKLAAMGFGPGLAGLNIDRKPGPLWQIPIVAVLIILSAAVLLLLKSLKSRPSEHLRSLGLLAFLAAMGFGVTSVGLGRNPFETRYVTLFFPVWCCVYFICILYLPQRWRAAASLVFLLITAITLWPNTRFGIQYADDVRGHLANFERDMKAGVPRYKLIYRHCKYLHPHEDLVRDYMLMLREAGVGNFRYLRDDPPFREISVPLVPRAVKDVRWQDGTAYTLSGMSYLEFSLPQPLRVAGVRIKYSYSNVRHTLPYFYLYWRGDEHQRFEAPRFDSYSPTGDRDIWARATWGQIHEPETTNIFWVLDTVKDLQLHPDLKPGVFRISELTLLLAEDEPSFQVP